MKNPDLSKEIIPTETELKNVIVNYVGKSLNPEGDEVTVENIIEIFAKEFPEFLLAVAEENWINGYTQALKDTEGVKNEIEKLHSRKEEITI